METRSQIEKKSISTRLQIDQKSTQNRAKIEEKSMQNSIEKMMPLGIDFWDVFDGFLVEKWRHVGTKIDQKSMPTSKSDFLKKTSFSL